MGFNTSHAQNNIRPIVIDADEAYTNHLFEMSTINVRPKDFILLQHGGHKVFNEMWTQQHTGNFQKFSLVAKKQEVVLITDEW